MPEFRPIPTTSRFPDIGSKLVTLIDVERRLFAITPEDKLWVLERSIDSTTTTNGVLVRVEFDCSNLLAVWTGKFSSHVFEVTEFDAQRWFAELKEFAGRGAEALMPSSGRSVDTREKNGDTHMTRIRVEVGEGQGSWTPVPDGTYNWEIVEVKEGNSQSGTASFGTTCEVTGGPAAGKKSTFWYYLTKKAGWRIREVLEATGTPFEVSTATDDEGNTFEVYDFDTDDLIGKRFNAQIKIDEYEGKLSNKIVKFTDLVRKPKAESTAAPAAKAAPTVVAAPKAAAAPPKGAPPPRAK